MAILTATKCGEKSRKIRARMSCVLTSAMKDGGEKLPIASAQSVDPMKSVKEF